MVKTTMTKMITNDVHYDDDDDDGDDDDADDDDCDGVGVGDDDDGDDRDDDDDGKMFCREYRLRAGLTSCSCHAAGNREPVAVKTPRY